MKYAAYGLLAAFLASGAHGAIPDTASDWYTPSKGFETKNSEGRVYWSDIDGSPRITTVTVDENGEIKKKEGVLPQAPKREAYDSLEEYGYALNAYYNFSTALETVAEILKTETIAMQNRERIETIGENLDDLLDTSGFTITNPQTGQSYTVRVAKGTIATAVAAEKKNGNATIPVVTEIGVQTDGKTIEWTDKSASTKLQLRGAATAAASARLGEWWEEYGFAVPVLLGDGNLEWRRYGGLHDNVFATYDYTYDNLRFKRLTLAGWLDATSKCDTDIKTILTSENGGSDRSNHYVLTRYGTGRDAVFHYVPFGDRLEMSLLADDRSITTNTAHGAATSGIASIYGFDDADNGDVPHKSQDGSIEWKKPGAVAVDDTTITTDYDHGAVTSGEASIFGWRNAANDTYLSKNAGGTLEWRAVDAVPGVDGASVVTNTEKQLSLNGYSAADVGAIPQKTAQGLSWLKASSSTNIILAGAGINITDNGGGAITISAQSFNAQNETLQTATVVTDVRYDETSHKFQKKTRTLVFKGSLGTESAWTDVFWAVSHKSEHEAEEE